MNRITPEKLIFIYLIIMNALGLILMIVDKDLARKRKRRISEANLFTVAILGGSLGSLVGMYMVRHKTKHPKFTIGMPVILCVHILLIIFVLSQ